MSDTTLTIRDVMTPLPLTITAGGSIEDAQALMETNQIHHLPVLDSAGKIVGILTQAEISSMRTLYGNLGARAQITAGDICSRQALVVGPQTTLAEVATELGQKHVSAAVVADQGTVIGIFTLTDACRWIAGQSL